MRALVQTAHDKYLTASKSSGGHFAKNHLYVGAERKRVSDHLRFCKRYLAFAVVFMLFF
jgi:hypothetical protein